MRTQPSLKRILAFVMVSAGSAPFIYGSTGQFGYGLELRGTGAGAVNSGMTMLYALDDSGDTRLLPVGSSATLDTTSWLTSSESAPTFSLGTFNPDAGDTLILLGGAMLTWQGATDSVGPGIYENIRMGGPTGTILPGIQFFLNETNVSGTLGDTRWSNESQYVNLLTGLAPGTYTVGSWGYASSSNGDMYENDIGLNYGATFTVVSGAGLPTTPTNITYSVTGGTLKLSWPAGYQGWILQSQTNGANIGLQTNSSSWHDVQGSTSVTSTNFPIAAGNASVFYRLRLP